MKKLEVDCRVYLPHVDCRKMEVARTLYMAQEDITRHVVDLYPVGKRKRQIPVLTWRRSVLEETT